MYQWVILVIIVLVLFVLVYQKWYTVTESDKKTMFSFDSFLGKKNETDLSFRPLPVTYKVYEIPHIVSLLTCYQLCKEAKPLLQPSSHYTFTGCIMNNEITKQIQAIGSLLSGFPISHMENVIVTSYNDGDELAAHYDMTTVDPISKRVCTLLIFLNEGYNGGEIEFVHMDQIYHGTTGKGLFFWTASDNKPIYESKYKSRKVFLKTKWMATLWIRSVPV